MVMPLYNESSVHFSLGPFSCSVTLPEVSTTKFGEDLGPFMRKNEAKKAAAMVAVRWLRENDMFEKRTSTQSKSSTHTSPSVAPVDTPQAQPSTPVKATQKPTKENGDSLGQANSGSLPQRVNTLAQSLGITPPMYPSERFEGDLYTMHAQFDSRDIQYYPQLGGEVGKVERAFGQKAAKQQCARTVVHLLEQIERERMA